MADHWDYPVDGKGDCKIYALYKRKLLQEAGFPRQALLMTVVHDLDNEGHTILTVKTDKGDLVLDNLVDEIRPWNATGYYFVKRQSQQNPNIWVSINQRGGTPKTPQCSSSSTEGFVTTVAVHALRTFGDFLDNGGSTTVHAP